MPKRLSAFEKQVIEDEKRADMAYRADVKGEPQKAAPTKVRCPHCGTLLNLEDLYGQA